MKTVRRICAVLVGCVFFIAGLLKLMDPVGAGLVVEEYFKFLHIAFMIPAAKVCGVLMALLETVLGAALITGMFHRVAGIVTGAVLVFFTLLTLALWILNPTMDCGCFGEAIHLTHVQSFIKNVVLLVLWLLYFFLPGTLPEVRSGKKVAFAISVVSVAFFSFWSLRHIPLMDFTPFKPGAVLMQAMDVPDTDAPLLSFCDADGNYLDDTIADGAFAVVSCFDPERMDSRKWQAVSGFFASASASGLKPLLLLSHVPEGFDAAAMGLPEPCTSDRRTLLTLNRSNGGATYIAEGQVIAKWAARSLPAADDVKAMADADPVVAMVKQNTPQRMKLQGFLLYVFSVMLLL